LTKASNRVSAQSADRGERYRECRRERQVCFSRNISIPSLSRKISSTSLDANNDKMEKMYRQARKGKKNRTILTASLGAMTGLSPLVLPVESGERCDRRRRHFGAHASILSRRVR